MWAHGSMCAEAVSHLLASVRISLPGPAAALYCLKPGMADALLLLIPTGPKQDLSDNQFDSAVGFDDGMAALASLPTLQVCLGSVRAHFKHGRLLGTAAG